MPTSLLTLPYELREQILTSLLCRYGSVKIQQPIDHKAVFTPPISQVCRLLREQAAQVFYQHNTFTSVIDPEEMNLMGTTCWSFANTAASEGEHCVDDLPISMLPWHCPRVAEDIRHLRLNLYLPDPYSKRLWTELTKHLALFEAALSNGTKLKSLRILIATWHHFRELSDWQIEPLALLGKLSIRGYTEVRTRSLDGKLRAALQGLDLTSKLRDNSASPAPEFFAECCTEVGSDMDWEWEGGIVI